MTPVEQHFTRRFLTLYGAPATVDQKAYLAEYEKALSTVPADVLEEASNWLVHNHTYRNWPLVGECVAMVNTVIAKRTRLKDFASPERPAPHVNASKEMRRRVAELVAKTVAEIKERAPKPRVDYKPTDFTALQRPAFEQRWANSPTLQWLSLPPWYREMHTAFHIEEERRKQAERDAKRKSRS